MAATEDTEDFAHSIYPEIDAKILAGPGFPYKMAPAPSFQASIVKMFPPMLKVDTSARFITKYWYPPFETQAVHDHYSEIFALSPKERPQMYAGYHYSDKHALSPIQESRHGYVEELALSPVREACRKPAQCGRKPRSDAKTKTPPSLTAAVPEKKPPRGSRVPRTRGQVKDEKHKGCTIKDDEKPARGRKRKHLVEGEEVIEPVRKSRRSRNVIVRYARENVSHIIEGGEPSQ